MRSPTTTRSKGTYATAELFAQWKGSTPHWDLLMSPSYNYIGIGMAYRSSNGRTYGDVVLLDGPDRSPPRRRDGRCRTQRLGRHVDLARLGRDPAAADRPASRRTRSSTGWTSGSFVTVASHTVGDPPDRPGSRGRPLVRRARPRQGRRRQRRGVVVRTPHLGALSPACDVTRSPRST